MAENLGVGKDAEETHPVTQNTQQYRISAKRRRQSDEKIICPKCDDIIKEDDIALQCEVCDLWYCIKCTKISRTMYNLLQAGDSDELTWICRMCKQNFPRFANMEKSLKQIQSNTDERLSKVEGKLELLENDIPTKIEKTVTSMKEEIIGGLKGDLNELVMNQIREANDQRNRELNLMLFNLEEPTSDNSSGRKREDEAQLNKLSNAMGLGNWEYQHIIRIGKIMGNKIRPTKLVFNNKPERRKLLVRSADIKELRDPKLNRIIVARDFTPQQREDNRKLRNELTERRNRGEDVKIRGNRIVTVEAIAQATAPMRPQTVNTEAPRVGSTQPRGSRYSMETGPPTMQRNRNLAGTLQPKTNLRLQQESDELSSGYGSTTDHIQLNISSISHTSAYSSETLNDTIISRDIGDRDEPRIQEEDETRIYEEEDMEGDASQAS